MFEKDVYHLIRGMRAHRGNEREYIQSCLRECRKEIKGADMDQKATALLKLVYLEMFGYDMSWASFNVLEVMSSPKYLQKRVGYLAAVQSFRADTEVLMLAENLLKKDLNSPDKLLISLPLIAIPHVINPSMANSLLSDLISRMSHSQPAIRKKSIVTLYRLALVFPETLRPAWPKIKERLLDEEEDPSVTAAIVNVVCELGWRRPQDFLPLAPRLFELLTSGNNNWMAIKIIKLFSVLTPLESRLVKKLLPPLTSIIRTTPAMSLLYECINGIIQGGIFEASEGTTEGDEIARLCLSKLRAMIVVEGDPNLRYVALIAFAKITGSHADLVMQHSDVILECIDDADISIRMRALDLVVDMIDSTNLQGVVERLLKQLRAASNVAMPTSAESSQHVPDGVIPMAEPDDEDGPAAPRSRSSKANSVQPLPEDYRITIIQRILEMCSRKSYADMNDFEWYIGVLVDLVKQCPPTKTSAMSIADAIGAELQNVAVRVRGIRPEAAAAAQSLLVPEDDGRLVASDYGSRGVLAASAFIAGEYANLLPDPEAVLASLLHSSSVKLPANTLSQYLQAIPKIFVTLTNSETSPSWTAKRKADVELQLARIIHFLEPLALHPDLDVQERAVEYLELMRLASEAVSNHHVRSDTTNEDAQAPLLLTQALPNLFSGTELNPVANDAVRRVPRPTELDFDIPINSHLHMILRQADYEADQVAEEGDAYRYYHEKPPAVAISSIAKPAIDLLDARESTRPRSYQEGDTLDEAIRARNKAERMERYKDDPYYVGLSSGRDSGRSTPLHNILRSANGDKLDLDAIPVMELKLDNREIASDPESRPRPRRVASSQKKTRRRFEITSDETLDGDTPLAPADLDMSLPSSTASRVKKSLLQVDSSGLSSMSLDETHSGGHASRLEMERRQVEEEEMRRAIQEVERLRLEMQRAQERIQPRNAPEEGTIVKRKKKKRIVTDVVDDEKAGQGFAGGDEGNAQEVKKKKKKKKKSPATAGAALGDGEALEVPSTTAEDAQVPAAKRKKKRQVVFDET